VPNSVNSKNNKTGEVVESWNGISASANRMLFDFQIKLAAKKLACSSKRNPNGNRRTADPNYKNYSVKGKRFHRHKTYRHFGYTNYGDQYRTIDWIESLLSGSGIADYRKITMDLILAPYLVNVKKCDYDTAYKIIAEWLDKCSRIRRLDFSPRNKISYALKHANYGPVLYPMRLDTMKSKYPQMYKEIFLHD
jgi:Primase X